MGKCEMTGKTRFRTEQDGQNMLKSINNRPKWDKTPVRVYFCGHCDGWHLTSKERKEPLGRTVKNKQFKRFLNEE